MRIKFAEQYWDVVDTITVPGGAIAYIIEDTPGHFDVIFNPKEIIDSFDNQSLPVSQAQQLREGEWFRITPENIDEVCKCRNRLMIYPYRDYNCFYNLHGALTELMRYDKFYAYIVPEFKASEI